VLITGARMLAFHEAPVFRHEVNSAPAIQKMNAALVIFFVFWWLYISKSMYKLMIFREIRHLFCLFLLIRLYKFQETKGIALLHPNSEGHTDFFLPFFLFHLLFVSCLFLLYSCRATPFCFLSFLIILTTLSTLFGVFLFDYHLFVFFDLWRWVAVSGGVIPPTGGALQIMEHARPDVRLPCSSGSRVCLLLHSRYMSLKKDSSLRTEISSAQVSEWQNCYSC